MLASLNRVVAVLALTVLTVLVAPTTPAAHAADGVGKDAGRADLVFSGTVTEAKGTSKEPVYAVDADRIWKGSLTMSDVHVAQTSRRCGLDLEVDADYVFFVTEDGGDLVSGECAGTVETSGRLEGRLDDLLGASEPVESPQPESSPATFTPVEGGEPAAFTRVAAPGAAIAIVGLLGLLVVRRAAKRG